MKAALQQGHPNAKVRTLPDLESVLRIRLVLGGPAQSGLSDPDGVGLVNWQTVLYSCDLQPALDGNLYPYKDRFEAKGIPGALVPINASDKKDFARYMEAKMDQTSLQKICSVFEDVLVGLPLYFVDMTEEGDPMASWFKQQASIVQAEGGAP